MVLSLSESCDVVFERGITASKTYHSFIKKEDAEYFNAVQFSEARFRSLPNNLCICIGNRGNRSYNHTEYSTLILSWEEFRNEYLEHGILTLRKPEHRVEIVLGISERGKFVSFGDDTYFDYTNSNKKVKNYDSIPDFYLRLHCAHFNERIKTV